MISFLAAFVFSNVALAAPAACPDGQQSPKKSKGACCWEGQTWDKKGKQCAGEPTACPRTHFAIQDPMTGTWNCATGGVLGALGDGQELDGVFGSAGLQTDQEGGIGGLLGPRGSGLGGSATAPHGLGSAPSEAADRYDGGPIAPGLRMGDPIILGALDKALIDSRFVQTGDALRACADELWAEDRDRKGEVVVKFIIAKDGAVSKASTKSSTLQHEGTETCINEVVAGMTFPEPDGGGIVIASYALLYGAGVP